MHKLYNTGEILLIHDGELYGGSELWFQMQHLGTSVLVQ